MESEQLKEREAARKRASHGPECRTHMASIMPVYGSDCTCGGDWTAAMQAEHLVIRVLYPILARDVPTSIIQGCAREMIRSGYFVPADGTLAALAVRVEAGEYD